MSDVKERIAGKAYNKLRSLDKGIKDKRAKLGDWQVAFFDPGQPLEEYYPDQVMFTHGIIMDFGGFRTSKPIGRIDIAIQREAMAKQREIDALDRQLSDVLEAIARKLSIKRGRTVYKEQINAQTGEVTELPSEVKPVEIDIEEDDQETIKKMEEEKAKKIVDLEADL